MIGAPDLEVHAYRGVDEQARFHESLRHNLNESWEEKIWVDGREVKTIRFAVCRGALMLSAHDSDDESETYVLFCGSCSKRVSEIEGHSVAQFLDAVSVDPVNDSQMRKPHGCNSPTLFTGYLTPDYLRWCGYPASLLEKVRRDGPKYLWRK